MTHGAQGIVILLGEKSGVTNNLVIFILVLIRSCFMSYHYIKLVLIRLVINSAAVGFILRK